MKGTACTYVFTLSHPLKIAICLWQVCVCSRVPVCVCMCGRVCSLVCEWKIRLLMFGLLHAGKLTYGSKRSKESHLIGSLQGTLTLPCIPYWHHLRHPSMPVNLNHTHTVQTNGNKCTRIGHNIKTKLIVVLWCNTLQLNGSVWAP